jgi:hypothetical protein
MWETMAKEAKFGARVGAWSAAFAGLGWVAGKAYGYFFPAKKTTKRSRSRKSKK